MWKLDSVHEILKRDYQLRPVSVELFSMDGCNDLLVIHKREIDEVFKNLAAMNLPRNNMDLQPHGYKELSEDSNKLDMEDEEEWQRIFQMKRVKHGLKVFNLCCCNFFQGTFKCLDYDAEEDYS